MIRLEVKATLKGYSAHVESSGKISGNYRELLYEVVDIMEQINDVDSDLLVDALGMFIGEKIFNENDD